MYKIFGFYKFKKINNLKVLRENLENFTLKENLRGLIIISSEGVNGTISFNHDKYQKIKKNIKTLLNIKKFDNENLSSFKYQAFNKTKIKIKKEVVPIGIKIKTKILNNLINPKSWNKVIKKKILYLLMLEKILNIKLEHSRALLIQN